MPGRLIEGAGDALGPCDAEYFKEEPEAGAWVARFVAVSTHA